MITSLKNIVTIIGEYGWVKYDTNKKEVTEFELDRTYQGWVFKSKEAFNSGLELPCYIAELWNEEDDNDISFTTKQGLIDDVKEILELDSDFEYEIASGWLLNQLDWQSPITLLHECDEEDILAIKKIARSQRR